MQKTNVVSFNLSFGHVINRDLICFAIKDIQYYGIAERYGVDIVPQLSTERIYNNGMLVIGATLNANSVNNE